MAKIEFEAFVEFWNKNTPQHPAWGMKTAETHSKKNEAGAYETKGRTFRTVKVSRQSGIDLTGFTKGARVKVIGSEETESREFEGKTFYELIVWADSVTPVGAQGAAQGVQSARTGRSAPAGATDAQDSWAGYGGQSAEVPFG